MAVDAGDAHALRLAFFVFQRQLVVALADAGDGEYRFLALPLVVLQHHARAVHAAVVAVAGVQPHRHPHRGLAQHSAELPLVGEDFPGPGRELVARARIARLQRHLPALRFFLRVVARRHAEPVLHRVLLHHRHAHVFGLRRGGELFHACRAQHLRRKACRASGMGIGHQRGAVVLRRRLQHVVQPGCVESLGLRNHHQRARRQLSAFHLLRRHKLYAGLIPEGRQLTFTRGAVGRHHDQRTLALAGHRHNAAVQVADELRAAAHVNQRHRAIGIGHLCQHTTLARRCRKPTALFREASGQL